MTDNQDSAPDRRGTLRRVLLAVAGGILALSGATLIAIAMVPSGRPPEPPTSALRAPLSPVRGGHPSAPVEMVMPRSKPVALAIPSIGVRSSLLSLGLNADDTIEVPSGSSYDTAGWYRFSPTPGSLGPAVILGHVSGGGDASVFFELGRLRTGNEVTVRRRDGSVAVFEVTSVRRYPKKRFPTRLVYGNTDRAALRLITCGGAFDVSTGHYVDNIVVFASLVGSR